MTTPDVAVGAEKEAALTEIQTLRFKAWTQEVAHVRAREHDARIEGFVSLATVILSAVVGLSVFASLTTDPSVAAKIVVGVLSGLAAIAAAVNEWAPFMGRSKAHAVAATGFSNIHDRAWFLYGDLDGGDVTPDEARAQWKLLVQEYGKQEGEAPTGARFAEAKAWVDAQRKEADLMRQRVPGPGAVIDATGYAATAP